MIALDANVLVYTADSQAGERHEHAVHLVTRVLRQGQLILPAQILAEFSSVAVHKLALDPAIIASRVHDFCIASVVEPYTQNDITAALELVQHQSLSFWDALALTVCDRVGVTVFASEDLQDGRRYGRTLVVNPFRDGNLARLGLAT